MSRPNAVPRDRRRDLGRFLADDGRRGSRRGRPARRPGAKSRLDRRRSNIERAFDPGDANLNLPIIFPAAERRAARHVVNGDVVVARRDLNSSRIPSGIRVAGFPPRSSGVPLGIAVSGIPASRSVGLFCLRAACFRGTRANFGARAQ